MTENPNGWEPDSRKMGNWRAMFEQPAQGSPPPGASSRTTAPAQAPREDPPDEEAVARDLSNYRPWILQRGPSRPAMMLELRRYEARSGLWQGWGLSYPSLQALEYLSDRIISLDFGTRQIVVEGRGLDVLARHLQEGIVAVITEHSSQLWPAMDKQFVSAIRIIEAGAVRD